MGGGYNKRIGKKKRLVKRKEEEALRDIAKRLRCRERESTEEG